MSIGAFVVLVLLCVVRASAMDLAVDAAAARQTMMAALSSMSDERVMQFAAQFSQLTSEEPAQRTGEHRTHSSTRSRASTASRSTLLAKHRVLDKRTVAPNSRASELRGLTVLNDDAVRESLMELFESTGGAEWRNSSGWGSAASVCTWHGVTCSTTDAGVAQVTGIELFSNLLLGVLPDPLLPALGDSLISLGLALNNLW